MGNQCEQTLLTLHEIAAYLVVNERTVYRLVKERRLPGYRVGGQWRFKRELVDAWMSQEQADQYRHGEKLMVGRNIR